MMPYCEYNKCGKVADTNKIGILRTWDSYNKQTTPSHTQNIWLCNKHFKKISKELGVKERSNE